MNTQIQISIRNILNDTDDKEDEKFDFQGLTIIKNILTYCSGEACYLKKNISLKVVPRYPVNCLQTERVFVKNCINFFYNFPLKTEFSNLTKIVRQIQNLRSRNCNRTCNITR